MKIRGGIFKALRRRWLFTGWVVRLQNCPPQDVGDAGQERPDRFKADRATRTQMPYLAWIVPKPYLLGDCENTEKLDSRHALFSGSSLGVCGCPLQDTKEAR